MEIKRLKYLHKQSFNNRNNLEKGDYAFCFYCFECVAFHAIKEWTLDNTAICTHCGIDSLISLSDLSSTPADRFEELEALHEHYFGKRKWMKH